MSLARALLFNMKRIPVRASFRAFSDKKDDKEVFTFPHPLEHATGNEKKMMILEQKGIEDPYYLNTLKRGPGTKDKPNLVPSFEEKRLIGCICEEDATSINWLWIHKGDPKRCECGYWFKAIDAHDHFADIEDEVWPPQRPQ